LSALSSAAPMRLGVGLGCLVALAMPAAAAPDDRAATTAAVFLVSDEDMPAATRATFRLTLETALAADPRLEIRDRDLALTATAGAPQVDIATEAQGLLATGLELARQGKLERAESRLGTAVTQLERSRPFASARDLARAQFALGAVTALRAREGEARRLFVALLTWAPAFSPSDLQVPALANDPLVQQLWNRARRRANRLPTGSVAIESDTPGALALLDARPVGFTPTSVPEVSEGIHYVTVRADGYQRVVRRVEVRADKESRFVATLQAAPGVRNLERVVATAGSALGEATLPGNSALRARLGTDHVVFLRVNRRGEDTSLEGFVYELARGRLLARASATIEPFADAENAFERLARALYNDGVFMLDSESATLGSTDTGSDDRATPFYQSWWFWTGVGVGLTAAAIALPFALAGDNNETGCPPGNTCGEVIFLRF